LTLTTIWFANSSSFGISLNVTTKVVDAADLLRTLDDMSEDAPFDKVLLAKLGTVRERATVYATMGDVSAVGWAI